MSNQFVQYLKDTRGELRHVAWPTQTQTIVYAVLVAALSIGVSLYLGFFDFLFTSGLKRALAALPAATQSAQTQSSTSPLTVTQAATATPALPAAPAKLPSI